MSNRAAEQRHLWRLRPEAQRQRRSRRSSRQAPASHGLLRRIDLDRVRCRVGVYEPRPGLRVASAAGQRRRSAQPSRKAAKSRQAHEERVQLARPRWPVSQQVLGANSTAGRKPVVSTPSPRVYLAPNTHYWVLHVGGKQCHNRPARTRQTAARRDMETPGWSIRNARGSPSPEGSGLELHRWSSPLKIEVDGTHQPRPEDLVIQTRVSVTEGVDDAAEFQVKLDKACVQRRDRGLRDGESDRVRAG